MENGNFGDTTSHVSSRGKNFNYTRYCRAWGFKLKTPKAKPENTENTDTNNDLIAIPDPVMLP